MIAHTIVYVILCVLSAIAVYAASTPINKDAGERHQPGESHQDASKDL